jgi:iron complex transport system permease protein
MPTRGVGIAVAFGGLAFTALLSLAVGARSIPLGDVVEALRGHGEGTRDATIVTDLRVPRTLLGIAAGASLGLAGALMQSLTRNPLADPGLLGINAGAAAAVVIAIGLLGLAGSTAYVWFAFLGAGFAAVAVYMIGAAGRGGATPVRLALAGTAISAALTAVIYGIVLTDPLLLQKYNLWSVGGLSGRGRSELAGVVPFMVMGAVAALLLARSLNALAMGEDSARALGARVGVTRIGGAAAITLLCGAATAAVGPLYFLGLTVPHAARAICGPDVRWVLAYSAVLGAMLLLVADVIGRVLVAPQELQAGLMLAFVGAPLFVVIVRKRNIPAL